MSTLPVGNQVPDSCSSSLPLYVDRVTDRGAGHDDQGREHRITIRFTTTVAVLAVALAAATASDDHLCILAELAGEWLRSLLLPVPVDGLIVAASMSMLVGHRSGCPPVPLARFALALGIGASLAGNVVAADRNLVSPVIVKRIIAGWPHVVLALADELLMREVRAKGVPAGPVARPRPVHAENRTRLAP